MRNDEMNETQRSPSNLWLLLGAVFFLHYLRRLVAEPTFFDGQIYASIARNMAFGVGSTWRPQFSATLFPLFSEHPPLAFWLEAPLYRLFGEGIWIEKFYSLTMLLISAALLVGIWRRVTVGLPKLQAASALPLLLALIAGRLAWAFANNMLENTLIVFTAMAIWLVTIAYEDQQRWARRSGLIVGAGMCTALALMTKGPVGLFPIASCGIYWIAFRRPGFWMAVVDSFVMTAVVGLFFIVLWHLAEPHTYMARYLDQQLVASLSGARGQSDTVFTGFKTLLRLNAYPLVLTCITVLTARLVARPRPAAGPTRSTYAPGVFFLMTAISASLPLMVSPRLHSFYFNPSLAYYAAAMGVWCAPYALALLGQLDRLGSRRVQVGFIVILVLSMAVAATNFGKRDADGELIEATHKIASLICGSGERCGGSIATCGAVWQNWQLHSYLERYYSISIENLDLASPTSAYVLVDDSCAPGASENLTPVDLSLSDFRIYRR